jgi:hypothetical protein
MQKHLLLLQTWRVPCSVARVAERKPHPNLLPVLSPWAHLHVTIRCLNTFHLARTVCRHPLRTLNSWFDGRQVRPL